MLTDNYRIEGRDDTVLVTKNNKHINYFGSVQSAQEWIQKNARSGDVVAIEVAYKVVCK